MQNGIVTNDHLDALLVEAFKEIRAALRDSMRNMYNQELDDGKVSVEFKVHFEDKDVNDPTQVNIGAMRTITEPKIDYKVVHSIVLKEERKGTIEGAGYEVDFDRTGRVEVKKLQKAQTSFLDEDSASNWGHNVNARGEELPPEPVEVDEEDIPVETDEDIENDEADNADIDAFDVDEAFEDEADEAGIDEF